MPRADAKLGASVFDAHPYPTVLVDGARRVVHANRAARDVLGATGGTELSAALGCVEHAQGSCGSAPRCSRCGVERVVASALQGERARKRTYLLRTGAVGEPADLHVLVSAAPLPAASETYAVLVVQDVNELLADPEVLRVCAGCGRIEEEAEWYPLARYLELRLGLEGDALCPDCERLSVRR